MTAPVLRNSLLLVDLRPITVETDIRNTFLSSGSNLSSNLYWACIYALRLRSRLTRSQIQAAAEAEGEDGFSWISDIAVVPGKRGSRGSGASADETTDQRAFATPGKAPDQCATAGATTDNDPGTLSFALRFLADKGGLDRVSASAYIH